MPLVGSLPPTPRGGPERRRGTVRRITPRAWQGDKGQQFTVCLAGSPGNGKQILPRIPRGEARAYFAECKALPSNEGGRSPGLPRLSSLSVGSAGLTGCHPLRLSPTSCSG